jgi:LuxR family transcriptional regulator, maltose regulon positive regulatory protein
MSADPLDAGWAHLGEGAWEAARSSFELALARAETPEALEGLSWAAWWRDDGDAVFDARERAYSLYRRRGDAASAARMATWLACDELDFHGAMAVATGWLARADRLLEELEPGPEHGWLAFMQGYLALASGDAPAAGALARRALELGRRFSVPDLEMLGLALDGSTLVAAIRIEEGMRRLDEATATALEGEAEVPISGAWACCFMVGACTAVRDYERAFEWCDRIAEFADRYGSRYMLAFCRAEYGTVHLWRGRWAEAREVLEASLEDFSRSRPAWVRGPLVALAELRRRQGLYEEATRLLERAGDSGAAQLCRARVELDQGRSLRALELGERVLRGVPEGRPLDRGPALELLARARIARGELDEARSLLARLNELVGSVGTAAMRSGAGLVDGMLAAAAGDHEDARRLFEDAVDGFGGAGGPFEVAQARMELATTLLELGRPDAAAAEAERSHETLLALGAEAEAERAAHILGVCRRPSGAPAQDVTPREREVLALLADGLTNREIAERLVVSEHTVHRHVTNILRKLDLPSRTAAATHAIRSGLLEAPRE